MKSEAPMEADIRMACERIADMLVEKNRKYGNSAIHPVRIFSSASNLEQLKVRIDDKLSRVQNQQLDEDEDVIDDLIGYFVLLKIGLMLQTVEEEKKRKDKEFHLATGGIVPSGTITINSEPMIGSVPSHPYYDKFRRGSYK